MVMSEEITTHKNQNEMTSDISTIAADLTLTESEKTISTEPKFGFFDRQMAELEPKVMLFDIDVLKIFFCELLIFSLRVYIFLFFFCCLINGKIIIKYCKYIVIYIL
jgi:hypothetical protein